MPCVLSRNHCWTEDVILLAMHLRLDWLPEDFLPLVPPQNLSIQHWLAYKDKWCSQIKRCDCWFRNMSLKVCCHELEDTCALANCKCLWCSIVLFKIHIWRYSIIWYTSTLVCLFLMHFSLLRYISAWIIMCSQVTWNLDEIFGFNVLIANIARTVYVSLTFQNTIRLSSTEWEQTLQTQTTFLSALWEKTYIQPQEKSLQPPCD